MGADIKKILIIKIGAIGDAVMALSMLNEIDKLYPGAEITWICGNIIAPLIKSVERINEVIVIDDHKLMKGNTLARLDVMSKVWLKLAGRKFDLVINAYRFKGYGLLALTAFKKEYKSFSGKNRQNKIVSGRYHAGEYARLINGIDDWRMEKPVLPKIKVQGNKKFVDILNGAGSPRFILTPGGAQNLINGGLQRRWPAQNYRSIAEILLNKYNGCSVFLLGSKEDIPVYENFKDLPVNNLIGSTSLLDVIYLYNNCDVLISHDTGLSHLAKLTGIKTIVSFGPVNPFGFAGYEENIEWIWKGGELPCSPCYDGKSFAVCSNNLCMQKITVDMVMEKINNYFK